MRIVRYQIPDQKPAYGWLNEDQIGPIQGDIFGSFQRQEAKLSLEEIRILSPVQPSKLICVARNYQAHADEHEVVVPEIPMLFFKPPSSVIGPGEKIIIPPQARRVEQEAELAVVIGKQGRWISPEDAGNYILGYTIGNDVTERHFQRKDLLWTRGKGFDTFAPLGPWIETDFDPADALITCRINDELQQMASSRDMIFEINHLIAFTSTIMTLMPGDVILTGTPEGVTQITPGDTIEISIEGIGTLINPVIQADV